MDHHEPVIYAHRGGAGIAPENTLGAFRKTTEAYGKYGVWLEMDVQLTADGVLVVIHDHTLDRTTNCTGAVHTKTAAQVTACNAAAKHPTWNAVEPVPTLEAVLVEGAAAGWGLLVELKNIPGEGNFDPAGTKAADALLSVASSTGFPMHRLVVQSFFPTSLDRIEHLEPRIGTALLTTSTLPGGPKHVGFYASENAAYATARGYEITAPNHDTPDLNREVVQVAHAMGRKVVPWTVNDVATMDKLRSLGVDGIITDQPDLAFGEPPG